MTAEQLALLAKGKKELYGNPHTRPAMLPVVWEGIPAGLRALDQWVAWNLEWDDRRNCWTKIPLNVTEVGMSGYGRAKSNTPGTWLSLQRVHAAWGKTYGTITLPDPDGPGFVFKGGGGVLGIDIDKCRDPDTGELSPLAQRFVRELPTFWEVSPSGFGIKGFFLDVLPETWGGKGERIKLADGQEIEVYDRGRYFAVTGRRLDGCPGDVTSCGELLLPFFAEFFPPEQAKNGKASAVAGRPSSAALSDEQVVERITRTSKHAAEGAKLWAGDTSAHGDDHSAADLALTNLLAFYTGGDRGQIDRLFRTSGLFRTKWDELRGQKTYAELTMDRALFGRADFYRPRSGTSSTGESRAPAGSSRRVVLGTDERRVNDEASAALAGNPELYQRGGDLVRVIVVEASRTKRILHAAGPTIKPVSAATLREELSAVVDFRKVIKGEEETREVMEHPPQWCVNAVKDRGHWEGVRRLAGVTEFPIVRPDGSVCATPGYDAATEVYVGMPALPLDLPDSPTQADARTAAERLLEVVCDFPLASDAYRAAWASGLLTPLARFAFHGPAPLFLIEANVPGAGKGRLADAVSLIVTGCPFATASYSHESAEMRKCITSAAIAGDRLVLLDNVTGDFGNDALDAVLTSSVWKGRILGESREVTVPLLATWFATGNNLTLAGDMSRRLIHVLLMSEMENPEERSTDDFAHPDLAAWILENRPRLLTAALTILSAYVRAGCPPQKLPAFGSFEGWNQVVRGAVVWAGLADPASTRSSLRDSSDGERAAMRCVCENWQVIDPCDKGLTAKEFLDVVQAGPAEKAGDQVKQAFAAVRDAVETLSPKLETRKIGSKFKKWKNRVNGNFTLQLKDKLHGSRRWTAVAHQTAGGEGGEGGSDPDSPPFPPPTSPSPDPPSHAWTGYTATSATSDTRNGESEPKRRGLLAELTIPPGWAG